MKKYLLPIQFTKLTREDMVTYKDCYTCLLIGQTKRPLVSQSVTPLGERRKELHKAMQRFYEAFK